MLLGRFSRRKRTLQEIRPLSFQIQGPGVGRCGVRTSSRIPLSHIRQSRKEFFYASHPKHMQRKRASTLDDSTSALEFRVELLRRASRTGRNGFFTNRPRRLPRRRQLHGLPRSCLLSDGGHHVPWVQPVLRYLRMTLELSRDSSREPKIKPLLRFRVI